LPACATRTASRSTGHSAKKAAASWFKGRDQGVDDEPPTVGDACKEYVEDLRGAGRMKTAYDAEIRFKRCLYENNFGKTLLSKVRTTKIKAWRSALTGSPATQDRTLRALKAALNLAVLNRRISPAVAQEWRDVKAHKAAGKRRDLYLDLKQRRALLAAAQGGARDLIEAAAVTGARPGELVALKRADFDVRTQTITFCGKTGERVVPLSPAALKLFKRLAKRKLPAAPLLTDDEGRPWTRSAIWAREVRAASARAKLPPGVVLYTLRHSFITEALRAGLPVLDVARLTGTSLQMIQSHYGHLVASSARELLAGVELL
jgi:integrase